MVVHIENPYENQKTADVASEMIGKRVFVGWPFLREALVVAVSDSLFKHERINLIAGKPPRVITSPHAPRAVAHWKSTADRIEQMYSKKRGVITGTVELLLHVRPLKGQHLPLLSGFLYSDSHVFGK
jgi:hypothetical protein